MHARNACIGSSAWSPSPSLLLGFGNCSRDGGVVVVVAGGAVVVDSPSTAFGAVVVGASVVPGAPLSVHTLVVVDVVVSVPPSLPAWRGSAITAAGSAR